MSFWTSFRDAAEGVASVAGNFYLPGSSLITGPMTSKGSQNLLGSPLGKVANLGSGLAGLASGNLQNYGDLFRGVTGGAAAPVSEMSFNAPGPGGGPSGDFPGLLPGEGSIATPGGNGFGNLPSQFGTSGTGSEADLVRKLSQALPIPGVGPSGAGGSMPWGSPANLLMMGGGLFGLTEAERLRQLAAGMGRQADPFGPFRGQYAKQLSDLSANPALIQQQPGYLAGLDAVQRTGAAQGYTGSGNMMAAIAKYGGDFYNQTLDRYSNLAGAGFNPASASQINLQGQFGATNLLGNSLNNLAFGTYMAGR